MDNISRTWRNLANSLGVEKSAWAKYAYNKTMNVKMTHEDICDMINKMTRMRYDEQDKAENTCFAPRRCNYVIS